MLQGFKLCFIILNYKVGTFLLTFCVKKIKDPIRHTKDTCSFKIQYSIFVTCIVISTTHSEMYSYTIYNCLIIIGRF